MEEMRTITNIAGAEYDAGKTSIIFAEDMNVLKANIETLFSYFPITPPDLSPIYALLLGVTASDDDLFNDTGSYTLIEGTGTTFVNFNFQRIGTVRLKIDVLVPVDTDLQFNTYFGGPTVVEVISVPAGGYTYIVDHAIVNGDNIQMWISDVTIPLIVVSNFKVDGAVAPAPLNGYVNITDYTTLLA